jgi:hypothetical protein
MPPERSYVSFHQLRTCRYHQGSRGGIRRLNGCDRHRIAARTGRTHGADHRPQVTALVQLSSIALRAIALKV